MDTCARCNRPIDINKGYFIDHNSGVTMHSLLPTAVPASVDERLAA